MSSELAKRPVNTMQEPILESQTMERTNSVEVKPVPIGAAAGSCIFCPCNFAVGWVTVKPKEVVATTHCGVLTALYEEPGCFKVPFCWLREYKVSTAMQSLDLPNSKIVDGTGSPIMVSAIINYVVTDPKKAIFDTINYKEYLMINASAVLKAVVGNHSYDELKTDTLRINGDLKEALQPQVNVTGVKIISVSLNELNYAPEIAANMLRKQAAGALVDARKLIVEGAVEIANEAIMKLEKNSGVQLSNEDKVKIVTNLLTVTCGESAAQPAVIV